MLQHHDNLCFEYNVGGDQLITKYIVYMSNYANKNSESTQRFNFHVKTISVEHKDFAQGGFFITSRKNVNFREGWQFVICDLQNLP